ncbi:MAG: hypothetical protein LBT40_03700 [Deltaproteobacteria bacterium]|nr:hypothetical protein [Deltaproteobacteria bacterium]
MTQEEKLYRDSLIHTIWKDLRDLEPVQASLISAVDNFVNPLDSITSIKLEIVFVNRLSEIADKWAGRRDDPLPESTKGLEEMRHELEVDLTQGPWILEAFSVASETPAQTLKWMESLAEPLTLEMVFRKFYPGDEKYEALMTPPPSWASRHLSKNDAITGGIGTDTGADGRDSPGEPLDCHADADYSWGEPVGSPDVPVGLTAAR